MREKNVIFIDSNNNKTSIRPVRERERMLKNSNKYSGNTGFHNHRSLTQSFAFYVEFLCYDYLSLNVSYISVYTHCHHHHRRLYMNDTMSLSP